MLNTQFKFQARSAEPQRTTRTVVQEKLAAMKQVDESPYDKLSLSNGTQDPMGQVAVDNLILPSNDENEAPSTGKAKFNADGQPQLMSLFSDNKQYQYRRESDGGQAYLAPVGDSSNSYEMVYESPSGQLYVDNVDSPNYRAFMEFLHDGKTATEPRENRRVVYSDPRETQRAIDYYNK